MTQQTNSGHMYAITPFSVDVEMMEELESLMLLARFYPTSARRQDLDRTQRSYLSRLKDGN